MTEPFNRGGHYAAELEAPQVYRERRRRLAEAVGGGTIVLWGNGDERGYGDVGTFRQGSNFFYLTGVELPNAVLVLRPEPGEEYLFLPPRNEPLERWTGPKWGPGEETARALGFDQVLSREPGEHIVEGRRRPAPGFEGRLQSWLSEPRAELWTVYPVLPTNAQLGPTHRYVDQLRERMPTFAVYDISSILTRMRLFKSPGEVALLRKAVAATMAGQRAAAGVIAPNVAEGTVDGAVYAGFRAAGAEGLAFPTIVGAGFNGTVLHYDQNAGQIPDGTLVVVDIGARYGYYCGDLTRTYPSNGRFTDRQREIYDVVLEAHDAVAEAIRPGVTIADLRRIAYDLINDAPVRDRNGNPLGEHFIHGLGHFIGLDPHDVGGETPVLEPGMVLTNEPGVYLQDEALGVRIENDFLVTAEGCENLSAELPTTAEEIEALMAGEGQ
jgi:Xaa-Pro aminopeptidase